MKAKRPFGGMSGGSWVNLALASLLLFYAIQVTLDVLWSNTCGHLGTDYCAFWSAGKVASTHGYASVYDLDLLGKVQADNFPSFGDRSTFAVSPFAYLPVFLPPFQLLSLLPAVLSFWIWTLINAAALILYLRFFYRSTRGLAVPRRVLILILLSLPVFWNLLDGQVNVWLMICVGEFMRFAGSNRPIRAGLWLGGLLLKPQSLLLLVPAILIRGSRKMILGIGLSILAILGASLVMVGPHGIQDLLRVWLGFTQGLPTNDVDSMMNWRMIGFHLSNWVPGGLAWSVAAAGMLLTIGATIRLWRDPVDVHSTAFPTAILGTLAATALVAWHSHIHMAMFMIPLLVLLHTREWFADKNVLAKWTLLPAAAYVAVYLVAALIKINVLPTTLATTINVLRGGTAFGLNIWILGLALRYLRVDARAYVGMADEPSEI